MKNIVLISCSKSKLSSPSKAKDLYTGSLFKKSWKFAESLNPDKIFIISAKHHLLDPEKIIQPYDFTLNNQSDNFKRDFASKVIESIDEEGLDRNMDNFIILAASNYYKYLLPEFKNFELPLGNKSLGYRLQYLKSLGF